MTKTQKTKRALLASALSLIMCFTMLLGTTYAWFTDSVESGKNTIVAGNLDVELYYQNDETTDWTPVGENSNIFKKDALWEPGHTEVIKLKVANEGTLALKYQFAINIAEETIGINKDNVPFRLSDYILFGLADPTDTNLDLSTREGAINAVEAVSKKLNGGISVPGTLEKGASKEVTLVVYMPTTVGNEANYKTGTEAPQIDLGLHVFATQYTSEKDSFDKLYDKDAAWTGAVDTSWYNTTDKEFTLISAEQLAGLAEIVNSKTDTFAGKTVKLGANIDLNNVNWTPIGTKSAAGEKAFTRTFAGTFIGTGYTIKNLSVSGENALGLFGRTGTGAHIEGVTIDGAYVSGNDYVGAVVGYGYLAANCLMNCTVTNATIIAVPYKLANGEYDGGAKAGVIAGYALNGNITGNTVKNSKVYAYRDLGAIAGMLNADGIGDRTLVASGNTIVNVTLSYVGVAGKYADGKVNQNMNSVVGRLGAKASVADDNVGAATMIVDNKDATVISTLDELIAFAKDVNAGNTYAGKTVLLGADIDLNSMEWTPIGTGAGFNGTFDGQGHTISNLKISGNKSTVGLFANTYNGEIKNLTVENAKVSGRLNVGVVAGNPYTSKYTNITVKGHVEVNGMAYVGGVGGKNAYANWTDITVDVDGSSYVKAVSTENGVAYRTYVGGVVGFNGEGGHSFTNITSNIDVIGDICDIGGAFGIAHYNNKFVNVVVTGNVSCTGTADEIGGIAGVWHNQSGTSVSFTNCEFKGTVSDKDGAVSGCDIVGAAYSASGTGLLIIDGKDADGNWAVTDAASLNTALTKGGEVKLYKDVKLSERVEIPEGVKVSIDMNNGKISTTGGNAIYSSGDLTITGKGQISSVSNYAIRVQTGKLTIDSADISVSSQFGAVSVFNGAEVTINGGNFSNVGYNDNTSHTIYLGGYGTINIYGGTFDSGYSNGGIDTICGYGWSNSANKKAVINIYGGEFYPSELNGSYYFISNYDGNWTEINIYGGVYHKYDPAKIGGTKLMDGYKSTKVADDKYIVLSDTIADENIISTPAQLKSALSGAADAGSGDNTLFLTGDVDLSGTNWTPISVDGYNGAGVITIEGNGATITGLNAPLFAGGFAGKSGIVIRNLTIADSTIVGGTQGGGAFIDCADSMHVITLENCHLVNSTVSGERAGGLIGWCSGYAELDDGPVKTYVTIKNCSVVDSTVIGNGSAGGIAGHPGASDYTWTTIEDCVVKNVDIVSKDDGSWRTGAIVGTANNGHIVINNVTVEDVTLTQNGVAADDIVLYGRFVPSGTGTLVIDDKEITA